MYSFNISLKSVFPPLCVGRLEMSRRLWAGLKSLSVPAATSVPITSRTTWAWMFTTPLRSQRMKTVFFSSSLTPSTIIQGLNPKQAFKASL